MVIVFLRKSNLKNNKILLVIITMNKNRVVAYRHAIIMYMPLFSYYYFADNM